MTKVCAIVLECPNQTKHIYDRKQKKIVPIGNAKLENCQYKNHAGANLAFHKLWKESFWLLFEAGWHFEYGNLYVYQD